MSEWIIENSGYKRSSISKLSKMPSGPYLVCSQYDQSIFDGMDLDRVMKEFKNKMSAEVPYDSCPGVVAFCFNRENKLEICFKHYDSSD
jgi:hypothetical protein